MIDRIQTPLFDLRRLRSIDRDEYVRIHTLSREHFEPWMPARTPGLSFERLFERELEHAEAGWGAGTEARMVAVLPDGRLAGIFTLSQIARGPFQNAYAGWRVAVDQIRRGIATLGVTALLDLAFAPQPLGLGLHRVQANIIPTNGASLRVAEKTGFRREGLAKAYLEIAGSWQDHVLLAKLREEHTLKLLT